MLLEALSLWNRWGSNPLRSGILRDIVSRIVPYLHSEEIIPLTGPRRAGKSTVLYQLMDALEKQGVPQEAMLHVNFEEPKLAPHLNLAGLDEIDFFQNLKELKHKVTKTLRHKEVYRMPFIIRETPSFT